MKKWGEEGEKWKRRARLVIFSFYVNYLFQFTSPLQSASNTFHAF
jgi:hypothetical protein